MTLAKDERMLDEWRKCQAENAALWEFVRAHRAWGEYVRGESCDCAHDLAENLDNAREALRKYEQE